MEENLKSKVGFVLFIIIVLSLAVGGYFLTKYVSSEDMYKEEEEEEIVSYKIKEDQDYIYYDNATTISESAEIYTKDVHINIKGYDDISDALNNENNKVYKANITYIPEDINKETINYNNDNIYTLTYRNYNDYNFVKYSSLVVNDFKYSCFYLISAYNLKSYVFDTEKGVLLEEDDLLELYNITKEEMLDKLKQKLQDDGKDGIILVEETLNDLKYSLYINSYGALVMNYMAKTNEEDVNVFGEMEVKLWT